MTESGDERHPLGDEYSERDLDRPTDEVEWKIKHLENVLAHVSVREDKKVILGSLGLLAAILVMFAAGVQSVVAAAAIPAVVIGGLVYVIRRNRTRKRHILIENGLQCPHCGFLPHTLNASGLYYTKRCLKCRAPLDI